MSNQWEYMTATFDVTNGIFSGPLLDEPAMKARLDELGRSGWELVTVTALGVSGGHGTARILATLKRPLDS